MRFMCVHGDIIVCFDTEKNMYSFKQHKMVTAEKCPCIIKLYPPLDDFILFDGSNMFMWNVKYFYIFAFK